MDDIVEGIGILTSYLFMRGLVAHTVARNTIVHQDVFFSNIDPIPAYQIGLGSS